MAKGADGMAIRTAQIELPASDSPMDAYVAIPEGSGPFPAVIVIMEAFGLNDHIKDVTRRYANAGYYAIAPDLYHRAPGERVVGYNELPKVMALMGSLTDAQIISDLKTTIDYLKHQPEVRADRIGITGFCMGGRVAYLGIASLPDDLKAAAVYYGGRIVGGDRNEKTPVAPIDLTHQIKGAVIGFFGDQDQGIPVEQVNTIRERLREAGVPSEIHLYQGAGHGFFCDDRAAYHEPSAKDAWARTLAWFEKYLKQ
jgi:carboxymethylenebutenolidase